MPSKSKQLNLEHIVQDHIQMVLNTSKYSNFQGSIQKQSIWKIVPMLSHAHSEEMKQTLSWEIFISWGGKKDRQKNKSFKMKIYLYVWLRVNEIIFEIAQRACKWGLKILKTFKESWDPIHFWKLNARKRDHSAERHNIPLISQWSGVTPFPLPYMCKHTHTQRTIYIIKHDNKNTVKT